LSLQGATPTITVGNAAHTATISTSITGTSGLTLAGAGTLALTGNNTFTGGTSINSGSLAVTNVGSSTTVTGTGVTTRASNNALGSGTVTLGGGSLVLNALATVNQTGLSGRVFAAASASNDTSQFNFTATASGARYDANLSRFDLTSASGGGTAITPTTNVSAQWTGKLNITNAGSYRLGRCGSFALRGFA